jgi:hypothetical protein
MNRSPYMTSTPCYFCGNAFLQGNGKVTQWPWWAVCPHCQHDPYGQCNCVLDTSDNDHDGDANGGEVKPLWYKPHFIGGSIKGRYDRSMEEICTLEEADNFVKDLWTGLFALRDNDDILDSKIEDIIDRVVRSQARIICHPRCPRTFVVFDRMLLSRNLPNLMTVVKNMTEDLFASGEMRPLQGQDERLSTWRTKIARALGWSLPNTESRHERWAPAVQLR